MPTFCHTPEVFTAFDDTPIRCLDILSRPDDGKGNRVRENACVVGTGLIIVINWGLIDADALRGDDFTDLQKCIKR